MKTPNEIKVLLVDDDEEDFMLTRDVLSDVKRKTYVLSWVASYEEALTALTKDNYDACLIDYRLGKNTGVELIQECNVKGCRAPMILLTGQGAPEIDEMAMQAGAADYLVKDKIDSDTLDRAIRYSINQSKLLQEVRMLHQDSELRVTERTHELAQVIEQLEKTNKNLLEEIKERKQAEAEVQKNKQLYYTISENYPNGFIAVYNRNLEYLFLEGEITGKLGMDKQALIGKRLGDGRTNLDEVLAQLDKAFHGERALFEVHIRGYILQAYAIPLADLDGNIEQVMVVTQDITERKRAEAEMSKALDKERVLNELKSRFVSMASHEFRTPLGTILSSVSLIGKYNGQNDEDKRYKHIQRIKASVVNLTAILNDFLSLSKLEEGKVSYNAVPVSLTELCEEIKEEMQVIAKEGQDIICIHNGHSEIIELDKQILKNILINLVSNAIKYSDEHKPIQVRTEQADDTIRIKVTDEGIGIPKEDQQHIFDTFFRATNAMNIQGTGLGLNIVKKYTDMLGGQINFESQPGKGTTFTLTLNLNHEKALTH
jgi:signal transduction histidine kinase/DNA-binding NarL/FixJ family response regulator